MTIRKTALLFLLSVTISQSVRAQLSEGGLPLTMEPNLHNQLSAQLYVPTVALTAPDIDALRREDSVAHTGTLRIGALVDADIDIKNLGSIVSLNDGRKIWRLKIQVPGMQALGLYYDHFRLPNGVKYYLYNANGKQVLGAYSSNENPGDGNAWANEKVQGEMINLEMDIDPDVDISTINLHINNVAVFYRATAYLQAYATSGANLRTTANTIFGHYDSSSSCEVEAMCAPGTSFPNQRNAAIHIEYVSHGFAYAGSGTLVNNTLQDCTPYVLTATHILNSQNNGNSTFAQWIFYFNYQKPTCTYSGPEPSASQTVIGAYFRARAPYDSSSNKIVGDFMLLLLKSNPTSYGFYLAGWDNTNSTSLFNSGTFTCFHHPWGDVKKVAQSTSTDGTASFNNGILIKSHWGVEWGIGGDEEGSSGSGLFNASGRLIGILSGGSVQTQPCAATNSGGQKMSDYALFSKLSFDWFYTAYSPSSASTRLVDWLDPTGSGVTTLNGLTACTTAIPEQQKNSDTWNVYPNPTNGIFYITQPLTNVSNTSIALYNMMGMLVSPSIQIDNGNRYKLDISNYPAGIYTVRIIQGNTVISHKITLSR